MVMAVICFIAAVAITITILRRPGEEFFVPIPGELEDALSNSSTPFAGSLIPRDSAQTSQYL